MIQSTSKSYNDWPYSNWCLIISRRDEILDESKDFISFKGSSSISFELLMKQKLGKCPWPGNSLKSWPKTKQGMGTKSWLTLARENYSLGQKIIIIEN